MCYSAAPLGTNWWVREGLLGVPCGARLSFVFPKISEVCSTRSEFSELETHIISILYITYITHTHTYIYIHIIEPLKTKEHVAFTCFSLCDFCSKQIGENQPLRRGPIAWQPRLCREVEKSLRRSVGILQTLQKHHKGDKFPTFDNGSSL